jgi:hypothetical protein
MKNVSFYIFNFSFPMALTQSRFHHATRPPVLTPAIPIAATRSRAKRWKPPPKTRFASSGTIQTRIGQSSCIHPPFRASNPFRPVLHYNLSGCHKNAGKTTKGTICQRQWIRNVYTTTTTPRLFLPARAHWRVALAPGLPLLLHRAILTPKNLSAAG